MQRELTRTEKLELMGLLFIHGMALAAWFVPMTPILNQAGLSQLTPYAFAASAVSALLSPLFFGAMADRSVSPAKVLRWTALITAVLVSLVAGCIQSQSPRWLILTVIQIQYLFCTPAASLTGSIVFTQLRHARHQFGSIRAWGTIGWMAGCWAVSLMHLDGSTLSFVFSSLLWLLLSIYTLVLPELPTASGSPQRLTLHERFGLDAWSLMRVRDHRTIFITGALVAIPFSAFYPITPAHLRDLGFERTSAWMSLGQVSEIAAMMFVTGLLSSWRFKWVITAGLACGLLRYVLYACNASVPVLLGIGLHGFAFTFTYISTQIYLAQRIEAAWTTRAQALLSLMIGGVGNLIGYLTTGWWLTMCRDDQHVDWQLYWSGLGGLVLLISLYFMSSYRGQD
ncbi:MAG: MFS transporter [Pirellulaceae bacterium]|nr:MFS transporter [Pirellulaceae bacterium]